MKALHWKKVRYEIERHYDEEDKCDKNLFHLLNRRLLEYNPDKHTRFEKILIEDEKLNREFIYETVNLNESKEFIMWVYIAEYEKMKNIVLKDIGSFHLIVGVYGREYYIAYKKQINVKINHAATEPTFICSLCRKERKMNLHFFCIDISMKDYSYEEFVKKFGRNNFNICTICFLERLGLGNEK